MSNLQKGSVSAENLGFSSPSASPPYNEASARYYTGVDFLRFEYITKADAVAKLLPDVFEFDESPTVSLSFNRFGYSNAGAYLELAQSVECYYKGEKSNFPLRLYLNSDTPMVTGREWFGIPKLSGIVHFEPETCSSLISGRFERPAGILLASGVLRPDQYLGPVEKRTRHSWGLRIFPAASKAHKPVRELIRYKSEIEGGTVWSGVGTPHFTGASAIDPLHALPVIDVKNCSFIRGVNMSLQQTGEVITL